MAAARPLVRAASVAPRARAVQQPGGLRGDGGGLLPVTGPRGGAAHGQLPRLSGEGAVEAAAVSGQSALAAQGNQAALHRFPETGVNRHLRPGAREVGCDPVSEKPGVLVPGGLNEQPIASTAMEP